MPEELEAAAVWNVDAKRLIGGFALRCNKRALRGPILPYESCKFSEYARSEARRVLKTYI
jgi:hypothetical protein